MALFAALSYAVTQSGRGGGNIDRETTALAAAQIVQYAGLIQQTIQRLQISAGCADDELSFWDDSNGDNTEDNMDNYFNPNAPSDRSCHIFQPEGGSLNSMDLDQSILDTSFSSAAFYGDFYILTTRLSDNLGTIARDLVLVTPYVSDDFCTVYNENLSNHEFFIENNQIINTAPYFTGSFIAAGDINNPTNPNAMLFGGCVQGNLPFDDSANLAYFTLLIR